MEMITVVSKTLPVQEDRTDSFAEKKYLFHAGDWFFISSVVANSIAIGVLCLKYVKKDITFMPAIVSMISAFVFKLLSEIYEGSTWDVTPLVRFVFFSSTFDPTPYPREGEEGAFPILKKEIASKYLENLPQLAEQELWQKMFAQLWESSQESIGKNKFFEGLTKGEKGFNWDNSQIREKYCQAIQTPGYCFSKIEIDYLKEVFPQEDLVVNVVSLINREVDCFMNAVFQVIMHDSLLKKALEEKLKTEKTPQAIAFRRAVMLYSQGRKVSTFLLRQFMEADHQLGQQDASEFLNRLLHNLDPASYPDLFPQQTTVIDWKHTDASGQIEGKKTEYDQRTSYLFLKIPRSASTLSAPLKGQDLVDQHFQKKPREGESWKEETTGKLYTPVEEQVFFKDTPKRLVFAIDRFSQEGKIMTSVDMPTKLVVNQATYALKKVITHQGVWMTSGHYTALLEIEGTWIHANDEKICQENDISKDCQTGYLYFYELA